MSHQYETNSEDVRRSFEEHGTIKTFFDLIATRGMVFVTYVSPTPVSFSVLSHVKSMIYVQLRGLGTVYKVLKLVDDRLVSI